jgi:hypothetical protein
MSLEMFNIFNQVDLSWHVTHRHSKKSFPEDVIPIIVSNMDTTGTFTMAKEIAQVHQRIPEGACMTRPFLLEIYRESI